MKRYRSPYVTCHGPSMSPALGDGDGLVLAECAGPADLRIGDIIVYPHPSEPYDVAHRVIRFSAAGVFTRGDNNGGIDPSIVPWSKIRGRVIKVRRAAKSSRPAPEKRPASAKYATPVLLPLTAYHLAYLACMNGHEASGNACVSGPEAAGGCKSGAAASSQCVEGAAAGFDCRPGTGN